MNISPNCSVKKGLGGSGEGASRVEERAVEIVAAIGRDEVEEKGFGVGELVVGEEGGEDGEERREGVGVERESWDVLLGPNEEGEEVVGATG